MIDIIHLAEMGGGPASYTPGTHVVCSGCFLPDLTGKQSSVAGEPTEPPLRALVA